MLLKQEFYKYKIIYDKSDAKHSNKDYIGKAWADIAKAGHTPASELGQLTGYKSFAQVYL